MFKYAATIVSVVKGNTTQRHKYPVSFFLYHWPEGVRICGYSMCVNVYNCACVCDEEIISNIADVFTCALVCICSYYVKKCSLHTCYNCQKLQSYEKSLFGHSPNHKLNSTSKSMPKCTRQFSRESLLFVLFLIQVIELPCNAKSCVSF